MLARIREAGFFRCTQPLEAVQGPVRRGRLPCAHMIKAGDALDILVVPLEDLVS